jgi:stearoyl-CoA desaturase (delta-9 desaturase)
MSEVSLLPVPDPLAQLPPREEAPGRLSLGVQVLTLIVVLVPFVGLVTAIVSLWGWGFHWIDLGLLAGMYALTAVGITVGFHRLFTHRAFETSRVVQLILGVLGSMAVQAPLLKWVAVHRRHHAHSDRPGDPHSPHLHGSGVLGVLGGLWHAHLGWVFQADPPDLNRYIKDLRHNTRLRVVSALFVVWVALGLLIPATLGGLLTGSWVGVWSGLLWGGLARICLVHHVTWSINSACHLWGQRPYRSEDRSRNNVVFGVLGLGEGWHNSHHAFPTSARHGLRWWQIDVSYWVIRALALVGVAWNVRLPTQAEQVRQRRA